MEIPSELLSATETALYAEIGRRITGTFSGAQVTWSTIKWSRVYRNVRRLQARIVKAAQKSGETAS
jgi:N-terminal domain of reverse transcriptase